MHTCKHTYINTYRYRQIHIHTYCIHTHIHTYIPTGLHTGRHTYTHKGRHTHTYRQTYRQAGRQTCRWTYMQTSYIRSHIPSPPHTNKGLLSQTNHLLNDQHLLVNHFWVHVWVFFFRYLMGDFGVFC